MSLKASIRRKTIHFPKQSRASKKKRLKTLLSEKGYQTSAQRRLDFSLLILVLKSGEKIYLLPFGAAQSRIWLKYCIFSFKLQ